MLHRFFHLALRAWKNELNKRRPGANLYDDAPPAGPGSNGAAQAEEAAKKIPVTC